MKVAYAKSGNAKPFMEWRSNEIKLPIDSANKQEADPFLEELRYNIELIKAELEFPLSVLDTKDLCHYTNLSTLLLWLNVNDDTPMPKFRLSNTAYLNDPSEGQFLFEKLHCADLFNEVKNKKTSLSDFYIGSFSLEKDKLPMWTQYGDDSKGCCAVFSKSFFHGGQRHGLLNSGIEYAQALKLYRVDYCNNKNPIVGQLLINISNLIIKHSGEIMNDICLKRAIYSILDGISFFFKNDAYSHEDEVRFVLDAKNEANKPFLDRKGGAVPKLYMNVNNPIQLTEVILGPKVPNPYEITPFLLYAGVEKITLSEIPYR